MAAARTRSLVGKGAVYLSYTLTDKPFVRRLAARLEKSHFPVWLDEHDLIAGDPLSRSIGEALEAAKVVLVVVSKASVASKWLRYELNVATERMIKGECRVIPIVIDETALPAEVRGLLYADNNYRVSRDQIELGRRDAG